MPSPMKYQVNILIIIIPDANDIILPGHSSPSKYSTAYLVDSKNIYATIDPPIIDSKTGWRFAQPLKNCELIWIHTIACPADINNILINNFI
jgi:hypothetical protein